MPGAADGVPVPLRRPLGTLCPAPPRLQALLPLARGPLEGVRVGLPWVGLGLGAALLLSDAATQVRRVPIVGPLGWDWPYAKAAELPRAGGHPSPASTQPACSSGWSAAAATPIFCMA